MEAGDGAQSACRPEEDYAPLGACVGAQARNRVHADLSPNKENSMEREIWQVVTASLKRLPRTRPRGAVYTDPEILAVALWAALHDRPISWACRRASWPRQAWRRRLPDQSTMSRRLRRSEILKKMRQLVAVIQRHRLSSAILLVDGKAFEVSEHTTDPDARIGRGVARYAKGYKLHALIDDRRQLLAWRVHPLNQAESVVAQSLLRDAGPRLKPGAVLLGDAAYDSNRLHLRAAVHRIQLIAPRQKPDRRLANDRHHHRNRLRSVVLTEGRGSRKRKQWLADRRTTIERYFGVLASVGGGLSSLPAWSRRLHRCRIWIAAKLVVLTARYSDA